MRLLWHETRAEKNIIQPTFRSNLFLLWNALEIRKYEEKMHRPRENEGEARGVGVVAEQVIGNANPDFYHRDYRIFK